jgi:D-arabinose 1-dehydrogenase-like Zn-dependent alcohol dehydrogenase
MCKNALLPWQDNPSDPPHFIGSFATHYIVFPRQHFYKVPENVPLSVLASANCALAQVMFGIDRINPRPGFRVVVIGAGGLGLYASAVLCERGVKVVVLDSVAKRLALALKFGARKAIDISSIAHDKRISEIEALAGGTIDAVIEVAGNPAAFEEGLEYVRDGGKYLIMGNVWPGQTASIDPGILGRRALQLHFVRLYNPWYLAFALDFLSRTVGLYPYQELTAESFLLDQVEEALSKAERYEVARACLRPNP